MSEPPRIIDGSVLEGGGQIIRIALALSAIHRTPIQLIKIRHNRSKPGLAAQHLTGIKLLEQICSARVHNATIGSTQVTFIPGQPKPGEYFADTKTAGSVALVLQVALPVCFQMPGSCVLVIRGGTNCQMAPQIDYLERIFAPLAQLFGCYFDINVIRRGLFPRGGGEIRVRTEPRRGPFSAVSLVSPGRVVQVRGVSFACGRVGENDAEIMSRSAGSILKQNDMFRDVPINIEKVYDPSTMDSGSGVVLVAETEHSFIGGSCLGDRKTMASDVGKMAAVEILDVVKCQSCVDQYAQDQLIILMALHRSDGSVMKSRVKVGAVTVHTQTAIYVAELLGGVRFNIVKNDDGSNIIECG